MKRKMYPSGRSFDEISAQAQREFYEANGYHPTEEDCIRLTEEARAEIAKERENCENSENAENIENGEALCYVPTVIREDAQGTYQLSVNALLATDGKLFLIGFVDSESVGNIIKNMMYLADNNQPIKLYIDSSGGEIRAGLALIDVIEMLRKKVQIDVVCIGKAYSMAAVILAAGGKGHRFLLPHAEVMIHEPLIAGGAGGSASTVKSTAESLIAIRDVISGLLSKYTGKTQEDINEAISRDLFMTADKAIEFGMADKIADDI